MTNEEVIRHNAELVAALESERSRIMRMHDAGTEYRNALMWVFDRLSVDGGMTAQEQRFTMKQIGRVLNGLPSDAALYEPNEWDESIKAISRSKGSV